MPIHRLRKADIVKLANNRCKHGHTYLSHYNCYLAEKAGQPERLGFLDIECSNLDADFGIMLTYCIKDSLSDEIYRGMLTIDDIKAATVGDEDARIVAECIDDIGQFDKIVTYYGARFDVPYIRTRALACGVKFPNYGTLAHKDLYDVIKRRFKLSSNRLENACRVLLGRTEKTRIESKFWRSAARGDEESLKYVMLHNEKDVLDLEKLYNLTINFVRHTDTSI